MLEKEQYRKLQKTIYEVTKHSASELKISGKELIKIIQVKTKAN